jgi:hypothetical protein
LILSKIKIGLNKKYSFRSLNEKKSEVYEVDRKKNNDENNVGI